MFETAPELFGPQIDIILIIIGFNIFGYVIYAALYGKDLAKVSIADFKLSLVEILLLLALYLNNDVTVPAFGTEISWVWWYVIVSLPIELLFFFGYRRYLGISWNEMLGGK